MPVTALPQKKNDHWQKRVDLAAAFRWTSRLDMHEAVANHFSLIVDEEQKTFLINPNQKHFSNIKASDLLELQWDDKSVLSRPGAPDATAWGYIPQSINIANMQFVHSISTQLTQQFLHL